MLWGSDCSGNLRHRIVSATTPGVTSQQAPYCQPEALQRAVLSERLFGILAARGRKAAGGWREGRDARLIEHDGQAHHEHNGPRQAPHCHTDGITHRRSAIFSISLTTAFSTRRPSASSSASQMKASSICLSPGTHWAAACL